MVVREAAVGDDLACTEGGAAVFFFKQKTAYEIMPSLVGSEMCIRDRCYRFQREAAGSEGD